MTTSITFQGDTLQVPSPKAKMRRFSQSHRGQQSSTIARAETTGIVFWESESETVFLSRIWSCHRGHGSFFTAASIFFSAGAAVTGAVLFFD